jgi:hypothetical protein
MCMLYNFFSALGLELYLRLARQELYHLSHSTSPNIIICKTWQSIKEISK